RQHGGSRHFRKDHSLRFLLPIFEPGRQSTSQFDRYAQPMDISGMLRSGGLLPNPSRSGGQTVLDGPAGGLDPAGAGDLISNSACPELAACRWWQTVSEGGGGGGSPRRPNLYFTPFRGIS